MRREIMEKEKKNQKNSSSATFKAGAVSLTFIIILYQAALFINKAAVLRIEANRDHPDTVYVTVVKDAVVHSERRAASHSKLVESVRKSTRKVESFPFDPNTATQEDFERLGFSEKQAISIINYRLKGGRFRRKNDFAKSYVVSDSIFTRLMPYIEIPKIDINLADSSEFDNLPGIGGYFAAKMVSYREEIGGYKYLEQLLDIYNFGQERYDALKDLIVCNPVKSDEKSLIYEDDD